MVDEAGGVPTGIKVIIGFHLFSLVIWFFGQTGAVVAYQSKTLPTIILPAALGLFAVWGSWYLAKNRHRFR